MLPDETVVSASKSLIDVGVVGVGLLFTMAALVFVTKRLFAVQDKLVAAVQSHADDNAKNAALIEVVKNQMEGQADVMKTMVDLVRDMKTAMEIIRERSRG